MDKDILIEDILRDVFPDLYETEHTETENDLKKAHIRRHRLNLNDYLKAVNEAGFAIVPREATEEMSPNRAGCCFKTAGEVYHKMIKAGEIK